MPPFPDTAILSSHEDQLTGEVVEAFHITKRKENCISQASVVFSDCEVSLFFFFFESHCHTWYAGVYVYSLVFFKVNWLRVRRCPVVSFFLCLVFVRCFTRKHELSPTRRTFNFIFKSCKICIQQGHLLSSFVLVSGEWTRLSQARAHCICVHASQCPRTALHCYAQGSGFNSRPRWPYLVGATMHTCLCTSAAPGMCFQRVTSKGNKICCTLELRRDVVL